MRLFLCTFGFLFLFSSTLSAQWQRLPNSPDTTISDIASIDGRLFIIINDSVYHSTDHGETWDPKTDVDSVYRLIELNGMVFALSDWGHIWRWTNGKWKDFPCRADYDLAAIHDTI